MIVPVVRLFHPIFSHRFLMSMRVVQIRPLTSFLLCVCFMAVFASGCSVRNAEYDQLISNGDYVQAKQLIRRLLDEFSYRDENPSMPARRAQLYYWLANAHGKLAEYDSLKLAGSLSVSNDPSFEDSRQELFREFALLEYNLSVARYNEGVYPEAITGWKNAIDLTETDPPANAFLGLACRNLGFAEAANNNIERAVHYLTKASEYGDDRAKELLSDFHAKNTLIPPDRLPTLDAFVSPDQAPISEEPPEVIPVDSARKTDSPLDLVTTTTSTPPWTVQTLTADDIANLPMRGPDQYVPLLNGVSDINNGLHIRGSRTGETGYLLEGISVLNPFYNTNGIPLIPEAIERIEIHSGAYGSALGSMGGGMIRSRMKTGGEKLRFFLDIRGDDLARPGTQFAGTSAFGYRTIAGTLDGPLPILDGLRFFLAGEHYFTRNRDPMFLDPFRYDLVTDDLGSYPSGIPLPGPVEFKTNRLPNNWLERSTLQGNATFSLAGVDFKFLGSYSHQVNPEGGQWPQALRRYFVQNRNPLNTITTRLGVVSATSQLGSDTRVEASIAFFDRHQRVYDPDFRHNFRAYTDSLANAQLGYTGFYSRLDPPSSYSTIFSFSFDHPSTPNNSYSKENQFAWLLSGTVTHKILPSWLIEAGASTSLWTMRYYRINNIRLFRYNELYSFFASEEYRRPVLMRSGEIRAAGYQYDEPSVDRDGARDGPVEPEFSAVFVENSLSFDGAIIDIGLRLEVIDPNLTSVSMTVNPVTGKLDWYDLPYDFSTGMIEEDLLTETPAYTYLLPRIGATFALSDRTTARMTYGMFANMHRLSDLHQDDVFLSSRMNPISMVPYNLGGPSVSFLAEPERSDQFEIGLSHRVDHGISASAVFFEKSLNNQLQLERIADSQGNPIFVALKNGGKAVSRGLEISFDAILEDRWSTRILYSWSDTKGRLSDPLDWRYVSDDLTPGLAPEFLVPLDYDQTHRGMVLGTLSFGKEDGPILAGTSVSLLFTFRSGQRYTAMNPVTNIGASGLWNIGVKYLADPRNISPASSENEVTAPWYYNFDLRMQKSVLLSHLTLEFTLDILNLFNRKHILNFYPTTGSPNDDGWLSSVSSVAFKTTPLYEEFYRTINLRNRWAYMGASGNDMYGTPRQVRLGISVMY